MLPEIFGGASVLGLAAVSLAAGIGEEVLFRGFLQAWLATLLGSLRPAAKSLRLDLDELGRAVSRRGARPHMAACASSSSQRRISTCAQVGGMKTAGLTSAPVCVPRS